MMLSLRPLLPRLLLLPLLALSMAAMAQGWLVPSTGQPEFHEAGDVFRVEATAGDDGATRLSGTIAPGYYVYRQQLSVVADGGEALPLSLPNGEAKNDEFFGRTEVYYDTVEIGVDSHGTRSAPLHWQGCADAGICYPPQAMRVDLPSADASSAPANAAAVTVAAALGPTPSASEDQRFASRLANASLFASVAEAGARGQWTLVDFYADWCVSCHIIEREVFGDRQVAAMLAGMQVVRPDVTANDPDDQALMKAWQVAGPPTLLLIGPDGQEHRAERTVGDITAAAFLARLQRVQNGES